MSIQVVSSVRPSPNSRIAFGSVSGADDPEGDGRPSHGHRHDRGGVGHASARHQAHPDQARTLGSNGHRQVVDPVPPRSGWRPGARRYHRRHRSLGRCRRGPRYAAGRGADGVQLEGRGRVDAPRAEPRRRRPDPRTRRFGPARPGLSAARGHQGRTATGWPTRPRRGPPNRMLRRMPVAGSPTAARRMAAGSPTGTADADGLGDGARSSASSSSWSFGQLGDALAQAGRRCAGTPSRSLLEFVEGGPPPPYRSRCTARSESGPDLPVAHRPTEIGHGVDRGPDIRSRPTRTRSCTSCVRSVVRAASTLRSAPASASCPFTWPQQGDDARRRPADAASPGRRTAPIPTAADSRRARSARCHRPCPR